jgi:hypothetical protein
VPALNKEDMEQLKEDMVLQAAPVIIFCLIAILTSFPYAMSD